MILQKKGTKNYGVKMPNAQDASSLFNHQIGKKNSEKSFIYTVESIMDESNSLLEAKERIMFLIMKDIYADHPNWAYASKKFNDSIDRLKYLTGND